MASTFRRRKAVLRPRLDHLEARALMAVDFDYSMPFHFGLDLNNNGLIDLPNTATYANPSSFAVNLSVSGDTSPGPNVTYDFTLRPANGQKAVRVTQRAGDFLASPPAVNLAEGNYRVTFQRFENGRKTDVVNRLITINDILIVSMGDSYASGEGDPERPQTGLQYTFSSTNPLYTNDLNTYVNAVEFSADLKDIALNSTIQPSQWADAARDYPGYGPGPYDSTPGFENMQLEHADAHRSTLNATAQYALQLERSDPHTSVTYVSVAQSGATVASALTRGLNPGKVNKNYGMPSQVDELSLIVGSRKIDQLFISLGGNDVGFTSIATDFIGESYFASDPLGSVTTTSAIPAAQTAALAEAANATIVKSLALPRFNQGAKALPASYKQLSRALASSVNISPSNVFMTEYPDTTRINQSMNNGATTVPWWGTAVTDILPDSGLTSSVSFIASQFLNRTNPGQLVPNTLVKIPLNNLVQQGAAANGWNYIGGMNQKFLGKGYSQTSDLADESSRWAAANNVTPPGTGSNRFVRTARESVILIGPIDLLNVVPVTTRTTGTLHPNVLGHQAMSQVIQDAVAPNATVSVIGGRRYSIVRGLLDRPRASKNAGLTFEWDFERNGDFHADARGRLVLIPTSLLKSRGTLKLTNRYGVSREIEIAPQVV